MKNKEQTMNAAMDYYTLLEKKRSITEDLINPVKKQARVFSYSTSVIAPAPIRTIREIKESVLGAGIARLPDNSYALKIFVQNDLPLSHEKLVAYLGLEKTPVKLKRAHPLHLLNTCIRQRPPFPGVSIGHYKGTTGTFGAVVKDSRQVTYILSNNHVLTNNNKGTKGDDILQPGPTHNGNRQDIVGTLSDFIHIKMGGVNTMDAAIARLQTDVPKTDIPYCGPFNGNDEPQLGAAVRAFGAITQGAEGVIITTDVDYQVFFNQTLISFNNLFEIKGVYKNGKILPFSTFGDSGSLIVDVDKQKAVGLLFAGIPGDTSFACPLSPILDGLGVVLV